MDPENYVLLNSGGAENFLRGLLRVEDDGNLAMAPAMSCEVAFSFGMDWNLRLPTPSERQRRYLAYHRQHIFGQWSWAYRAGGSAVKREGRHTGQGDALIWGNQSKPSAKLRF